MTEKKTLILLAAALAVLLTVALIAYRYLSDGYENGTSISENAPSLQKAPDFAVLSENSEVVQFSDFAGKPIVINFWATWCGPCRSEFPAFQKAYETHGEDVHFMMINLTDGSRDTVQSVKAFAEEYRYTFPIYFDTGYNAANAYGISPIPVSVFINAEGEIVQKHTGAMTEAQLTQYLSMITE